MGNKIIINTFFLLKTQKMFLLKEREGGLVQTSFAHFGAHQCQRPFTIFERFI